MSQQGNEPGGDGGEGERAGRGASLRAYLARILGYESTEAIEHALRSIELGLTHRTTLVLLGETDMVPIAIALHHRTLGIDRPFVLSDPRRANTATNFTSGVDAIRAARGGSLCVRRRWPPRHFPALVTKVRDPAAAVQLIVCAHVLHALHPFLVVPVPIVVPALKKRAHELPRIVDEYASEALRKLGADAACFTSDERSWVIEHAARTLPEIGRATMRLVALRQTGSIPQAAARLGLSYVTLYHWLNRRGERLVIGSDWPPPECDPRRARSQPRAGHPPVDNGGGRSTVSGAARCAPYVGGWNAKAVALVALLPRGLS